MQEDNTADVKRTLTRVSVSSTDHDEHNQLLCGFTSIRAETVVSYRHDLGRALLPGLVVTHAD